MLPLGVPILETRGPAIVDMEGVPTISTAATPFETRSSRKTIDLVATPRQDLGTPQKILDKTNTIRVESPRIEVRLPRTSPKMAVEEEVGGSTATDNYSAVQESQPVGGCLNRHLQHWQLLDLPSAIESVLRHGYILPFASVPPRTNPRIFPSQGRMVHIIQQQVSIMLDKGAIEVVDPPYEPGFYSRLFVVPKASGGWRPVINLKSLNRFISAPPFKMETVQSIIPALEGSSWAVTIDLSDAYFHVPMHPMARVFLRFVSCGRVYQFKALPFGLSTAPFVFTWILRPFVRRLRAQGIQIHVYQDDWLIHHRHRETLKHHLQTVLALARDLGFRVNMSKSQLEPVQVFTYLGVEFDLRNQMVRPPMDKCRDIVSRVNHLMSRSPRPASEWMSFLGKLAFVAQLVPEGRLHCRQFQCLLRQEWTFQWEGDRHMEIPLRPQVVPFLRWWLDVPYLRQGVRIQPPLPTMQLFTDASTEGWGAHLLHHVASGLWSPHERLEHINALELRAILRALSHFRDVVRGQTVMIATDNSTVLGYLRNQGGTKSVDLLGLTYQFFALTAELEMTFLCRHVPGRKNILADQLSRADQVIHTEWTMSAEVLEDLWRMWPRPQVDAFATCLNHRLPMYFSPVPDPRAVAVDALAQPWDGPSLYLFPPTPLLPRVLRKLQRLPHAQVVLIFPKNTLAPWYPLLVELSRVPGAEVIRLPPREDLMVQPITGRRMPNILQQDFHALKLLSSV